MFFFSFCDGSSDTTALHLRTLKLVYKHCNAFAPLLLNMRVFLPRGHLKDASHFHMNISNQARQNMGKWREK